MRNEKSTRWPTSCVVYLSVSAQNLPVYVLASQLAMLFVSQFLLKICLSIYSLACSLIHLALLLYLELLDDYVLLWLLAAAPPEPSLLASFDALVVLGVDLTAPGLVVAGARY